MEVLDRCETRHLDEERVRSGREMLLGEGAYAALAEIFGALGDPNRAKIVYSLLHQELCVCELAAIVGISESAVSQHLRVLRVLRLVRFRREGKMTFYSLNDDHVRRLLDVCLEHLNHG